MLLVKGQWIIIPHCLRAEMLQALHQGHAVHTKMLLVLCLPGIDNIQSLIRHWIPLLMLARLINLLSHEQFSTMYSPLHLWFRFPYCWYFCQRTESRRSLGFLQDSWKGITFFRSHRKSEIMWLFGVVQGKLGVCKVFGAVRVVHATQLRRFSRHLIDWDNSTGVPSSSWGTLLSGFLSPAIQPNITEHWLVRCCISMSGKWPELGHPHDLEM